MKKIPTLFVRNEADRRHVTDQVTPGCEWVLAGEGIATRKYDGTCTMLDEDGNWWARREVKPGKKAPEGWLEVDADEATGKRVGWEPIAQSPFAKFHAEALSEFDIGTHDWDLGTYELIGPKINGNPERTDSHRLIRHGLTEVRLFDGVDDPDFVDLQFIFCGTLVAAHWEGLVWHHPDGRMVKLKVRDFPEAGA